MKKTLLMCAALACALATVQGHQVVTAEAHAPPGIALLIDNGCQLANEMVTDTAIPVGGVHAIPIITENSVPVIGVYSINDVILTGIGANDMAIPKQGDIIVNPVRPGLLALSPGRLYSAAVPYAIPIGADRVPCEISAPPMEVTS